MTSRIYSLEAKDCLQECPSPIKRKAKIFARKLPEDFFLQQREATAVVRSEVKTHAYQRKMPELARISETREINGRRGNLSSRMECNQ